MRKWKWPLFFVAVALAIIAVAREQHYAREKYEAQKQADCIELSISPTEKHDCAKDAQSRKDYAPWGYVLMAWPEGITTWAIIVTFVFIGWQADETRKAAEAALLNAQAVINAERPWMLVSVKPSQGQMGGFDVRVRNRGRTPAIVIEARMGCIAAKSVSDLSLPAVFPIDNPVKNKVVIPGSMAHIMWFDESLFKAILKDKLPRSRSAKQIFVYGKVLYCSLANPNKSVVHETRWICEYQFPSEDDEGNSLFRVEGIGVSDEYDRYS